MKQRQDRVDVHVAAFHSGQPITPVRWPNFGRTTPENVGVVSTTWRELILASVAVGVPEFRLERFVPFTAPAIIKLRVQAVRAGLQTQVGKDGSRRLASNDQFAGFTDPTEHGATSNWVGMTMAHWTAIQVGFGSTIHLSRFSATDPRRSGGGQADLHAVHPTAHPSEWLIEAKGGAPVKYDRRVRGAGQLDAAHSAKWSSAHGQILVSTKSRPLVEVVAEFGLPSGVAIPHQWDRPAQWPVRVGAARRRPRASRWSQFVERVLFASALLVAPERVRLATGGDAYVVEVPESGVRVGLTENAYSEAVPQVRRLAEYRLEHPDMSLSNIDLREHVLGDVAASDVDGWRVMDALLGLPTEGDVMVTDTDQATDTGAVVDGFGRVVITDESWNTEPNDVPDLTRG